VMERLAAASLRRPGSVRNRTALAVETGLSLPVLEQVVHFLELAGLLKAAAAPTGGIRLSRAPSRISLLQVVRAIDGAGLWRRCIMGLEECSEAMPCPAHPVWKTARSLLENHLDGQTMADLSKALARRRRLRRTAVSRPGRIVEIRPVATIVEIDTAGDR
jgi:Rrf2 family protein